MHGPIDLEQYNNMTYPEKAELLHQVWTERGFKAPDNILGYSPIYPEQALGYLELIINSPDSPRVPSYYSAAKTLLMLWCLLDRHPAVDKGAEPQ
jgi:hypothetical protein